MSERESLFDDAEKREQLMYMLGRAGAVTAVGHGLKLDEKVSLGSLTWATTAFDTLHRLAILAGTDE